MDTISGIISGRGPGCHISTSCTCTATFYSLMNANTGGAEMMTDSNSGPRFNLCIVLVHGTSSRLRNDVGNV